MIRIPRVAHFVFELGEQLEPLPPAALSGDRDLPAHPQPERIYLHYRYLPFGVFWDEIRPHPPRAGRSPSRSWNNAYDERLVPARYRYSHHADFVRLDALVEHGGVYADIDTIFVRPLPDALYREKFVIGREPAVVDEITGELRPSLCNALMMAEPGSVFGRTWRARMGAAINGTWSNHSGFLAQTLSEELPDEVRLEPEASFFPVRCTPAGLASLLEEGPLDLSRSYSVHLWAHVWWAWIGPTSRGMPGRCPSPTSGRRARRSPIRAAVPAGPRHRRPPDLSRAAPTTWSAGRNAAPGCGYGDAGE